jgi:hypothetical protein
MRGLHTVLIGTLMAVTLVLAGSDPANAARTCKCTSITSSGYCTDYGECHELLELAGPGNFKPFRNTRACRRSQALLCDFDSCKVVCETKQK